VITERLARRCRYVVAVEKDSRLAERLGRRLGIGASTGNVGVYLADFLDFPLPLTPYKVFANLPFNVTAAAITRLVNAPLPPSDSYLVVQREAAARFLGRPEARVETLTAALLKPWFEPSVIYHFQRTDFAPPPGVDVVMLRLRKRGPPLVESDEVPRYRDFVTACFAGCQPTVGRAVATLVGKEASRRPGAMLPGPLKGAWVSRPSEVPFEAWLDLFRWFANRADAPAWKRLSGVTERLRRQQASLQKVHRTRVRPPPRPLLRSA
jgi:23S rRNA (adenine-N6)-dimethyltransferase